MRFRTLALLLPLAAVPASAATLHLKVQADPAGGQKTKVTVKALSRVAVTLPAEAIVYVDEGQGFKPRADLHCKLAEGATLRLEADRAVTASCELPVSGKRIRLGYKVGEAMSTSNAATLQASGEALASK